MRKRDGERKGRDQAVTSLTRSQPVHIMAPLIGPFRCTKTPKRPWVSITHERRVTGRHEALTGTCNCSYVQRSQGVVLDARDLAPLTGRAGAFFVVGQL